MVNPIGTTTEAISTVLSRGGKATGQYKNWLNVQFTEPFETSVNSWNIEEDEQNTCLYTADETAIQKAKMLELESWRQNNVYDIVAGATKAVISTKWVISKKPDGRVKARLVARGFEDPDLENVIKYSPTASKESLRILLTVTSSMDSWRCCSLDVQTAFLQGTEIKRDVFLKPPKEFGDIAPGCVFRLRKSVYGLADAPRCWYEKVKNVFHMLGGKISKFDAGLFTFADDKGRLIGLICVHVDDFFCSGNDLFEKTPNWPTKTFSNWIRAENAVQIPWIQFLYEHRWNKNRSNKLSG